MPFIDRTPELESLEERWGADAQVALLWGRRRIGKSTLLQHFAMGKPRIFHQAIKGTQTEQLVGLTDRILAYRADPLLAAAPLANWQQAVAYLVAAARQARADGHPLLIVLDEFPYLVASNPDLPSILQAALDDVKREQLPLFLVLAGSQVAMFERHVLQGPLYGRRTWGEQLGPLSYSEAGEFFPGWSPTDRLRAWAVLGGVPYYLEQFNPDRSLAWNIENRILGKGQVLYSEAELFVAEELGPDAPIYQSIIAAIAGGATRQSEIAQRAGVAVNAVPAYLQLLRRLDVVEHVRPYGAPSNARSGIWQVADGYLRFWFRFVRANVTDLESRRNGEVFRQRVLPQLDHFVSKPAFEDACREYLRRAIGEDQGLPAVGAVGSWWGQVPDESQPGTRRTKSAEVDLVVYDGPRLVLAGEAKWHAGPVDTDALAKLSRAASFIPGYNSDTRLAIFARDGFTDHLRARAGSENVVLRTVTDLYR